MSSILHSLFQFDLCFTLGRDFEAQYAFASERVSELERRLQEKLPPECRRLLEDYLRKSQEYQAMGEQYEFERGFLMAGKIFLEVFLGQSEESACMRDGPLKDGTRPKNEG